MSGLPAFLTADAGAELRLHDRPRDGGRAGQREQAALAHPASVDSLPTSANQEDHVSMATLRGAPPRHAMAGRTAATSSPIELLAAAQGIDFLRPLQSSAPLEVLHAALRAQCASMPADHYLAPDIERANALLWQGGLRAQAAPALAASTQNHAP
jgi:histidine ammonia-lyase